MQNKRDIEILVGVLLLMSTAASIVALILYHLFVVNVLIGAGALISAYILQSANLVPRIIWILGLAGALIIFIRDILIMFGLFEQLSSWGVLLAIPFFGYEISLTIRLLSKGFNEAKLPPTSKQNLFRLAKNQ